MGGTRGALRGWSFILLSALAAGCGAGSPPRIAVAPTARTAGPDHIVVIVLENHEYGDIVGSPSAPYLNALIGRSVLLTREFAIRHPSLPDYLALTGGATFGITSDCTDCSISARNIVGQLNSHHISWKAYMQAMPRACFGGNAAGRGAHRYVKRHDPFIYYRNIRNRPFRCHRIVPLTRLRSDFAHGLPRFTWITPDICFDMHSCSVRAGDRWLGMRVPGILRHLGSDGILIIVFDEGRSNARCCSLATGGGHVMALITGPGAKVGARIRRPVNHYSILRLIEDAWGLPRLAHAADRTTPTIWGWRA